jgi:hypothetical protein
MSGEQIPPDSPHGDPPIEDVLASIRRVLSEDQLPPQTGSKPHEGPPRQEGIDNDVLVLEPSMMASDTTPERPRTASEGRQAPAMNVEDMQRLWLWEQAAVRDHLARLEHKIDVLGSIGTAAAAIGVSTGLGVLAGFFLGVGVGAAVYGVSCVVTVVTMRFAFNYGPSGRRKR